MEPVDPNYKVIAVPDFVPLQAPVFVSQVPKGTADVLNCLLEDQSHQLGYVRAIITSDNRYMGAAAAKDSSWQERQLLAAKLYGYHVARLEREQLWLLAELEFALQVDHVRSITITAAKLNASITQIQQNGFPTSVIDKLTAEGFSVSDISALQSVASSTSAKAALTYPNALTDPSIVKNFVAALKSLDQFAADRNGDMKVDCSDVDIVRAGFGLNKHDRAFDPRADVNGDGAVDSRDLRFVEGQLPLGTECGKDRH
jgi:hypothetical protein